MSFPRQARITRGAELQCIVREGRRIRTTHIEVRVAVSPLARTLDTWAGIRIGIIVPLYKHSAVARNKVKRRLRELARLEFIPTGMAVNIVLRARPEAYDATYEALRVDMVSAVMHVHQWRSTAST